MEKNMIKSWARSYLPLFIAMSLIFLAIVVTAQQIIRASANDPQIQLAEDYAQTYGQNPGLISASTSGNKIDISKSLDTFVGVFDDQGKQLSLNYTMVDQTVTPPTAVFDYAKKNGRDLLTWQPQTGTRIALVVEPFSGKKSGFVIVGRSMREIEKRSDNIQSELLLGWILSLIVVGGISFCQSKLSKYN